MKAKLKAGPVLLTLLLMGCGDSSTEMACGDNPSGAPVSEGPVTLTQGDVHYVCSFKDGKFDCGPPRTSKSTSKSTSTSTGTSIEDDLDALAQKIRDALK